MNNDIQLRAYEIWQRKCNLGIPDNSRFNNARTNWEEAEIEILNEIQEQGEAGQ